MVPDEIAAPRLELTGSAEGASGDLTLVYVGSGLLTHRTRSLSHGQASTHFATGWRSRQASLRRRRGQEDATS